MRPRFLINLLNHCKGFAVNLNHKIIQADDIEKGFKSYSMDILTDIGYELRDVLPESENILYNFLGSHFQLNETELKTILAFEKIQTELYTRLVRLLLWHGFLGIKPESKDEFYIYTVNYNMQLLSGLLQKYNSNSLYIIHPSFRPALLIDEV